MTKRNGPHWIVWYLLLPGIVGVIAAFISSGDMFGYLSAAWFVFGVVSMFIWDYRGAK